jgi:ABC-type uncharacterized transport system permease subunit
LRDFSPGDGPKTPGGHGPDAIRALRTPVVDFVFRFLFTLLPAGYFAYARRAAADFRGGAPESADDPSRAWLGRSLIATHVLLTAWLSWREGHPAIGSGAHLLNALALCTFGVFLFASRGGRARALGMFVASFGFVAAAAAVALGLEKTPYPSTRGALFGVHVGTAVFAASVMLISGCAGVVYLVLERQMRRKTFGVLYRGLPNLSDLAALNRRAAAAGFLAMTVGVNWGIWLAHRDATKGFSYLDPKVLASIALWLHFGVVALPRKAAFVTGARAAKAAAFGLVLLVATLIVSAIPGLSFHKYS